MIFLDGEAHRPVALGVPSELARSADNRKLREFLALPAGAVCDQAEAIR
jgi:hypothetical protein